MFIVHALTMAFAMFWEILWALILGFALSGAVQAVVSKKEMSRLLPDDSPHTLLVASLLGAASSSCSYAAVALARSLFRKGANFTTAIAFQLASTNVVLELGIIMIILLGWQFAAAEFIGAPIMVGIVVWLFRRFLMRECRRRFGNRSCWRPIRRSRCSGGQSSGRSSRWFRSSVPSATCRASER